MKAILFILNAYEILSSSLKAKGYLKIDGSTQLREYLVKISNEFFQVSNNFSLISETQIRKQRNC